MSFVLQVDEHVSFRFLLIFIAFFCRRFVGKLFRIHFVYDMQIDLHVFTICESQVIYFIS